MVTRGIENQRGILGIVRAGISICGFSPESYLLM